MTSTPPAPSRTLSPVLPNKRLLDEFPVPEEAAEPVNTRFSNSVPSENEASVRTVSLPPPASSKIVSFTESTTNTSLPAPPAIASSPTPPSSQSLPAPPLRVSKPLPPRIRLLDAVPTSRSLAKVPSNLAAPILA